MTFTSNIFLIGLLPFFVVLYRCLRNKSIYVRKILFLLANTLFLIWGGAGAFLSLCAFTVLVYLFAIIVFKTKNRYALAISLSFTVVPLVVTKYIVLIIGIINSLMRLNIAAPPVIIPVGISFITFEAISFLVDILRGKIKKKPTLLDTFLYLTFFPTVTSGPILRYNEFEEGLLNNLNFCNYTVAIERIAFGLCKKTLIADKISILADYYFDGVALGNSYSCLGLWVGSIAYSLQLYFDFSGYSDMAIGIGKLLGFNVRENFNKPYQACSISDFWKRWHISLTQWFRDYIYIPLGGNRVSKKHHIINMIIVWLLTGIWHGADWTFIIWGMGYAVLLVIEKYIPQILIHKSNIIGRIYTLFFVNLLWVFFRANSLSIAARYIWGMFGEGRGSIEEKSVRFIPLVTIAIMLCLPWEKVFQRYCGKKWFVFLKGVVLIILVCLAICSSTNSSYAPYIYGNF